MIILHFFPLQFWQFLDNLGDQMLLLKTMFQFWVGLKYSNGKFFFLGPNSLDLQNSHIIKKVKRVKVVMICQNGKKKSKQSKQLRFSKWYTGQNHQNVLNSQISQNGPNC